VRKKLKYLYPAIIFTIFFSLPVFALPCQNVEVITDREYFQVVHRTLREASHSIQLMMYTIGYYKKYPDSPSNILCPIAGHTQVSSFITRSISR